MIQIVIRKRNGKYRGFQCKGHADYADEGFDIICAAVSVLTVNTVNSIEAFTDDHFSVKGGDEGLLELALEGDVSERTRLLLDSMVLGLQEIQNSYGNEYIELKFKEV